MRFALNRVLQEPSSDSWRLLRTWISTSRSTRVAPARLLRPSTRPQPTDAAAEVLTSGPRRFNFDRTLLNSHAESDPFGKLAHFQPLVAELPVTATVCRFVDYWPKCAKPGFGSTRIFPAPALSSSDTCGCNPAGGGLWMMPIPTVTIFTYGRLGPRTLRQLTSRLSVQSAV